MCAMEKHTIDRCAAFVLVKENEPNQAHRSGIKTDIEKSHTVNCVALRQNYPTSSWQCFTLMVVKETTTEVISRQYA